MTRASLRPFALKLVSPLDTARGPIRDREGFVVSVDTADSDSSRATGVGEATPLPGWTESLSACESALLDAGVSTVAADDETPVSDQRQSDPISSGPTSTDPLTRLDPAETPAARHGLALALADAAARDAERSLSAELVADCDLPPPAETVPVNATIGDADPDATAAAAASAVDEGFDCLKVKVGARSVDADAARFRAVRDAVGDAVALRADANGAWDLPTARATLDRFAPFDLEYVEQPLPAADLDAAARLRADAPVPIALDESLSEHDLDAVLDARAADVIVVKPMALGGPDRALSAALRARAAGVDPVVTTTIDAVVARTAAVHVAAAIPDVRPCGLATRSLLKDDLAADPCQVVDGAIEVPNGPGLAGEAFDALRC
ncbi:mandelate racemase/muconate lactonizing enzyme family protein [Halorubrum laminariae]|uniref:o-succinylbenzoate synthase n=1 Tax=Halorubrum laminariae TaxID=1433523 RepID=A0ABD6C4P0_9EURY|nr:enolase C-terminal domain-like protein [Halorubrum laminariae]